MKDQQLTAKDHQINDLIASVHECKDKDSVFHDMGQKLKETEDILKAQVEKEAARIRSECGEECAAKLASLKMQHQQELNDLVTQSAQHVESLKQEYEQRIHDLKYQLE